MNIPQRIATLRSEMASHSTQAFIIFSADPHMGEYLPDHWKEREWISGFTGSAGWVVITQDQAGLWTDGRYFAQAPVELQGSGIHLYKDGVEGTPTYIEWLIQQLPKGATVAVNAQVTPHAQWNLLSEQFTTAGIQLISAPLLEKTWVDRALPSSNPVFTHPVERAGLSVSQKIEAIRKEMEHHDAELHLVSTLDDIAWITNLRGSDVECNPVFLSYLIISSTDAQLFVDKNKLTQEAIDQMQEAKVEILPYEDFYDTIAAYKDQKILVAPTSNHSIFQNISEKNTIIKQPTISALLKAQKNSTELEGFRTVMVRDGVAMVKFLHWLTKNVGEIPLTECTIAETLRGFRAEGKHFVGVSFGSIIGYKENGAIIHYAPQPDTCKEVHKDGSILLDSGGQYLEGTTDITRTWPLGAVSEEFKINSTLVLQGMIRLSMAKFPKGTKGVQLDALARLPLWQHGKDYNHGTGHGVGSFMNVHEGPQNIRKDLNPQPLLPGMVCSNEPGYYVEGAYGIRHENLVAVQLAETTTFGDFYTFETLTLCPFNKDTIVIALLSKEEKDWLNHYHQTCKEKLAPHLDGEALEWLYAAVEAI